MCGDSQNFYPAYVEQGKKRALLLSAVQRYSTVTSHLLLSLMCESMHGQKASLDVTPFMDNSRPKDGQEASEQITMS